MTVGKALAYPFDRSALRVAIGDYNIAQAEQCIKEAKWRDAYKNLAFGTGRSPKNVRGQCIIPNYTISPSSILPTRAKKSRSVPYSNRRNTPS